MKRWTEAECDFVRQLHDQGLEFKEISRRIPHRSPMAIRLKLDAITVTPPRKRWQPFKNNPALDLVRAKAQLHEEIRAAQREKRTAPPYKPAWPAP